MCFNKHNDDDFLIFKVKCDAPRVNNTLSTTLKNLTINLSFLLFLGNQSKFHSLQNENKLTTKSVETTEMQKNEDCSNNTFSRLYNESTPKFVSTKIVESPKNVTEKCTEFTTQSIDALNNITNGKPINDQYNTKIPDDRINCTDSPILGEIHQVTLAPESENDGHSNDTKSTTLNYSTSTISNQPNNPHKPCEIRNELILLVENDINLKLFLNSEGIIEKTLLVKNKTDVSITNSTTDDIFDGDEIIYDVSSIN